MGFRNSNLSCQIAARRFEKMPSENVKSLHVRLSDLFQHRIRLKNNDYSAWATILFTSALCVASYWSSINTLTPDNSPTYLVKLFALILPLGPIIWFEVKLLLTLVTSRRRRRNHHLSYLAPVGTSSLHRCCRSLFDAFCLMFLIPTFLV